MKRILSLALLVAGFSFQELKADKSDLFNFEINEVNTELAQVEELDQYLDENDLSFAELQEIDSELIANVSDQAMMSPAMAKRHRVLGIPSWIWGCVFGVAGVAIVYFVADNKDETKEALWGCVGAAVIYIIVYFAAFATAASAAL